MADASFVGFFQGPGDGGQHGQQTGRGQVGRLREGARAHVDEIDLSVSFAGVRVNGPGLGVGGCAGGGGSAGLAG